MNHPSGLRVIVGLGKTGWSCAQHLAARHIPFAITDSRSNPPELASLKQTMPHVQVSLGGFDQALMLQASELIVSQGVSLLEPAIQAVRQAGIPIIGDIELFARALVNHPANVVAITGSNGKSTVTSWVGEMVRHSGVSVRVGGNLGTPALDLLEKGFPKEDVECYVLEVSNFQLEVTSSLRAHVATVLNLSPDHLDHYASYSEYIAAKQRVYRHCHYAVVNREDELTFVRAAQPPVTVGFTSQLPALGDFGLKSVNGVPHLMFGDEAVLPVTELKVRGVHNALNGLAALAIGHCLGLPWDAMIHSLRTFSGLPHRCAFVAKEHGVTWYNDSKGTNIGATLAAIEGLGADMDGKIVLLAGGQGKGADFAPLAPLVERYVRAVVLFGEDASHIASALKSTSAELIHADSLPQAVIAAQSKAAAGDAVLLSPACASWDMFRNYEHRGEVFCQSVKELLYGAS